MVPDFTIENSTVSVARQVEYDNGDMYIFVDTKEGPIDDTVINDYLRQIKMSFDFYPLEKVHSF